MQSANLDFKFRHVLNNQPISLSASKGTVSESAISLDGEVIPYRDIVETTARDNRLLLVLMPGTQVGPKTSKRLQNNQYLTMDISKVKAYELKKHIDRFGSTVWADAHREQLAKEGRENEFSTLTCPHCQATIDLSGLEHTAYVYCRFCGSIVNRALNVISNSDTYAICDECHMYDRVRGYTIFNFYFLLVIYGYSINRRFVCDTCATRLAQRALLINLIFILGVPSAIYMWIKSQTGRDPYFQELAKANRLARKGKYQEADDIYDKLFSLYPDHPGLLMDKGLGHLHGGDNNGGMALLNKALRACANYFPVVSIMQRMKQATAQTK